VFAEFWGRNKVLLVAAAALTLVALVATIALVVVRPHHVATPTPASRNAAAPAVSTSTTDTNHVGPSPVFTSPAYLPGSDPTDSTLVGGQTNQLVFAEKVATALFSYGPATDFPARNADVMEVALAAPLGDSAGLTTDLLRYTPTGTALNQIRSSGTTSTFRVQTVAISQWAVQKLQDIGAQSGTYGIDVVGVQTITARGSAPVSLSVSMGLTVACAPAVSFCGLDRIQAALLGQPAAG